MGAIVFVTPLGPSRRRRCRRRRSISRNQSRLVRTEVSVSHGEFSVYGTRRGLIYLCNLRRLIETTVSDTGYLSSLHCLQANVPQSGCIVSRQATDCRAASRGTLPQVWKLCNATNYSRRDRVSRGFCVRAILCICV